jgi:hypothetical protein
MESHVPVRTRIAAELTPIDAGETRRRAPRAAVSIEAGVASVATHGSLCRVTDLSIHGARIQTYGDLRAGSSIVLALPGDIRRLTRIVWSRDYEAGCQFDEPLSEAEFDALTRG